MYEPDLWWHLAQGREAAAGHFVRTNLFSFVHPDYPQPYTSWLFDLGGYVLWTRGGPAALQAVQALLIAATLGAIALACRIRSSAAAAISVCVFGWMILEPRALPRPHVFSFFGLAVCVWLVERARAARSATPLWWLPVVVAVWSNVHVECVFGLALAGLFAGSELIYPRDLSRREAVKALGIVAVGLLATACNPYGLGLLRYMFENSLVPRVLDIAELRPPYLPNYRAFFAWAIAGALVIVVSWLGRRRPGKGRRGIVRAGGDRGLRVTRIQISPADAAAVPGVGAAGGPRHRRSAAVPDRPAGHRDRHAGCVVFSRAGTAAVPGARAASRRQRAHAAGGFFRAGDALRARARPGRTRVHEHESGRLRRVGALSGGEGLPRFAAAGVSRGALPGGDGGVARSRRVDGGHGRRRTGPCCRRRASTTCRASASSGSPSGAPPTRTA